MNYMVLVYLDKGVLSEKEREEGYRDSRRLMQALSARDHYTAASFLHLAPIVSVLLYAFMYRILKRKVEHCFPMRSRREGIVS